MRKKSLVTMITALALTASVMVGATLAYFVSETKEVTNTFTVGNIEIELDEPKWDEELDENGENPFAQDLIPGVSVEKDPTVTNTGENDAYVAVTVKGMSEQYGVDLGMSCVGFDAVVNAGWVKVNADGTVDENWDDVNRPLEDGIYVYTEILPAESGEDSKTVPLFDKVTYNGFSSAPFLNIVKEGDVFKVKYSSEEKENDYEGLLDVNSRVFSTEQEAKNYLDSRFMELQNNDELKNNETYSKYLFTEFDLIIKAYAIQTQFGEGELVPTETNPYPWVGQLGIPANN